MLLELPYFIEVRGCINCSASRSHKEKTGKEYGFDHEAGVYCLMTGCFTLGHSLERPYIDPEELVRLVLESKDNNQIARAKRILSQADEQYRSWFETAGINLVNLIEKLEATC